jgi:hypothetical protein
MSLEEEESQVGTLQVIVVAGALAKNSNSKLNIVNKKVSKFFFPSDVILDPTPLAHQMMLNFAIIHGSNLYWDDLAKHLHNIRHRNR